MLGIQVIGAKLVLVGGGFALGWLLEGEPIGAVRGMLMGEALFMYGFLAAALIKIKK